MVQIESTTLWSGVTPAVQAHLEKLGIYRPFDLILHMPLRYEDETHLYPIAAIPYGKTVLTEGCVVEHAVQYKPRKQLLAKLEDPSGRIYLRFLHFYPSQLALFQTGNRLRVLGEVRRGFLGDEMVHPKVKKVNSDHPLSETLTPVYSTVAGLRQSTLQHLIDNALNRMALTDTLPEVLRKRRQLMPFDEAVRFLHRPSPEVSLEALNDPLNAAWQRLKFDELLAQQLSMRLAYRLRRQGQAPIIKPTGRLSQPLLAALPFALTAAQQRVCLEIQEDLAQPHPMRRLVQGDVGSGKTIVAALSTLAAIESGFQVAFMAPTEILAEQHYLKLSDWLMPLGIQVAWLSGSVRKKRKAQTLDEISQGRANLVVGTHALFQEDVRFALLGLVIVDEQHRFGVGQRLALKSKGQEPHQLMMSATPIPRTLAMSYYADLDVSVIDELPAGRQPIKTKLISMERRTEVMAYVKHLVDEGRQVYWVCPLIEESEALQLQTAVQTHQHLSEVFLHYSIGLLHGKMKADEKAAIMSAFNQNQYSILVATTVIEVGVDVPNACLIVIEHAERMGLSQLHQLRGRVGRGNYEGACLLLFDSPLTDVAKARLKVIYQHHDGFEIARQDLLIRGPGEFLGAKQSGMPLLRFADLENDQKLLDTAREEAAWLLIHEPLAAKAHMERWLYGRAQFLEA